MPKVIIKVGNKSTIRFRDVELFRAITVDELQTLSEKLEDASIIIVEHIYDFEYDRACEVLRNFKDKHIFFYTPDNDDTTSGVADELALDIYLSANDLYRAIEVNCGIVVNPDLNLHKGTESGEDTDENWFDTGFAETDITDEGITDSLEAVEGTERISIDTYKEHPEIKSKDDIRDGFSDDDFEELPEVEVKPSESEDNAAEKNAPTVENKEESSKVDSDTQNEKEITIEDASNLGIDDFLPVRKTEIEANRRELENRQNTINNQQQIIEAKQSEIDKLAEELSANSSKSNILESQIKEALNRIDELNKVIKAVKSERDTYQRELASFETSDIIEDPDTKAELEELKTKLKDTESKLSDAANISGDELDKLRSERDTLTAKVNELTQKNTDADSKVADLEIQVASLEQSLAEATNDSIKNDKINTLTNEIAELNQTIANLQDQLQTATQDSNNKLIKIKQLTAELSSSTEDKQSLVEMLHQAVTQMEQINGLQNQIERLRNENGQLNSKVRELTASEYDKNAQLEQMKNEVEQRVELARNFAKEELANVKSENNTLRAQFNLLQGQLTAKTAQYDELIKATGMDINGAMAVINTNKTLEVMNNTLRSQLGDMKIAYEKAEREKADANQAMQSLKDKNDNLTSKIRALSTQYSGGVAMGVIPPLNYTGRAQIVSIFGSGSFGITTSAITTALILSSNSRVLFVDFDLMNAKADTWFQTNPMIKGIYGTNPQSSENSGLGLLIGMGTQFFLTNVVNLLPRPVTNKSGFITYMSGMYVPADVVKLVSTDFNGFLNFAGNNYDYIVIDFGKIGASEINNQIIRCFCDISTGIEIVTSSDRIDIRNMKIKLQTNKINMEHAGWLINLSENTKVDDRVKTYISPAEYTVMPFIDDFYGQKKDFTKTRMSRDKFNIFLEKGVFRR